MTARVDELKEKVKAAQRDAAKPLREGQERVDVGLGELRRLLGVPEDGAGVKIGRSGASGDIRIDYPVLRCPEGVLSITVGGRQLHDHGRNDYVQDTLCRLLGSILAGDVRLEVIRGG